MQPIELAEKHSILLPFANIIGGMTYPLTLKVEFKDISPEECEIVSIKGVSQETQRLYNMDYLKEYDMYMTSTIFDLILYNKDHWDKSEIWW